MMPPPEPDKQEEMQDNVLTLHLMKGGKLTIDDDEVDINPSIRKTIKQFVVRVGESHIIELQVDRSADYDSYFRLQNQIVQSYKELDGYKQRIKEIVVNDEDK